MPSEITPLPAILFAMFLCASHAAAQAVNQPLLQPLIDRAAAFSSINIPPGRYSGSLLISKPLKVYARGAVLDYSGKGSAVRIVSHDVFISGLTVSGSGKDIRGIDSGIEVAGRDDAVEECLISNSLFGIHLRNAEGCKIESNIIKGLEALEIPDRGDGIRVTSGHGNTFSGNRLENNCDGIYFDRAQDCTVSGNIISGGHYGLHLMFASNIVIRSNFSSSNSIGVMLMDSTGVEITGNAFIDNRTINGAGICIFESIKCLVNRNSVRGNSAGVELKKALEIIVSDNLVAGNTIGIKLYSGVEKPRFTGNRMLGNISQIGGNGGRNPQDWSYLGRGNFWDDYRGYGINGTGVGDAPYRINRLFPAMVEKDPVMGIFFGSPLFHFLESAGSRDQVYDRYPLMINN
ncbi:MAG: nitrous oxide reductase family maturation protein NosD [Brevinematales bacterium]|jgi:nitrous oxidase accessory protein